MIHFFATKDHLYTIIDFLEDWAGDVKPLFAVTPYEKIHRIKSLEPGVCIFSDLERLGRRQLSVLGDLRGRLEPAAGFALLNPPERALRRFELLRRLHEAGINGYNAYPAGHAGPEVRFPVFLRYDNDHNGPQSGLLRDRRHLKSTFLEAVMKGYDMEHLIQVEYCDVRDADGLFRKYSAFRLGDRIIPGHIIFGTDWVTKDIKGLTPEMRREQEAYLAANPHEAELRGIFDMAGIGYGRIDYSLLDGRLQVWEINTNPVLIKRRKEYDETEARDKERLAARMREAFRALAGGAASTGEPVGVREAMLDWVDRLPATDA